MKDQKTLCLRLNDYEQKGLYLIFEDLSKLALTRDSIEKTAIEYWNNADKMPPRVKEAIAFQRCPFCPLKGKGDFCDALRPVLPLLDVVDKYVSFDKVTAIYKGDDSNLCHIADTTMQIALKYVSILSLMQYCQIGRKYWKYYVGIIPLAGGEESANRIYLNIYWIQKGNEEKVNAVVSEFREKTRITTRNQVKRLNMICKNDAFMNAFISAQITTEFLSINIDKSLEISFADFEKGI